MFMLITWKRYYVLLTHIVRVLASVFGVYMMRANTSDEVCQVYCR